MSPTSSQLTTDYRLLTTRPAPQRVRRATEQPIGVGFGISRPEQVREVLAHAEGAIVGSAIVDRVARHGRDCLPEVGAFIRDLKAATKGSSQ